MSLTGFYNLCAPRLSLLSSHIFVEAVKIPKTAYAVTRVFVVNYEYGFWILL